MKVLIVTRAVPLHGGGGMQVIAWDLARGLASEGVDVHLVTTALPPASGHNGPTPFEEDGVVVHPLEAEAARYSKAWWETSARFYQTQWQCAGPVLSVSVAALSMLQSAKGQLRPPFVLQAHGTAADEIFTKLVGRDPLRMASSIKNVKDMIHDIFHYPLFDTIVAVGPGVYARLVGPLYSYSTRHTSTLMIPNGVDTALFYPSQDRRLAARNRLQLEDADNVLVTATRLHRTKGLESVIATAQRLNTAKRIGNLRLLIIGEGPHRAALEQMVHVAGLEGATRFLGHRGRAEVAELLCAGDVFVYPTRRFEGLPVSILEALATGLQCVTTERAALPAGLPGVRILDTRNMKSLDDTIIELLLSRSSTGRSSLLPSDYSMKQMVNCYRTLLDDLADNCAHDGRTSVVGGEDTST